KFEPKPATEPTPEPETAPKIEPEPITARNAGKVVPAPGEYSPTVGAVVAAQPARQTKGEKKKTKGICYGRSIVLMIQGMTFEPVGGGPTPEDLRVPACMLRALTGTTDYDFALRNVAVGRFIVNGSPVYIPAANPETGIHSEDQILITAQA